MVDVRLRSIRVRSAVFAPIGDPGRAQRVEQRLEAAIQSGMLADGEKLPSEAELAAKLGVATVTAREALNSLRERGLITTLRGRAGGSFVKRPPRSDAALEKRLGEMSRVDLYDRFTVYSVLLSSCAELAAERSDAFDVEELRSLLPDEGSDDVDLVRHLHSEMVLDLAAMTQSARLLREIMSAETELGPLARLPLSTAEGRKKGRERTVEIIDAVEAHDCDTARKKMQGTLRLTLEYLARRQAELR